MSTAVITDDHQPTILSFLVSEIFSDRQTSQCNTSSSPRRFVHLTEHQSDLGLAIKLNDRSFLHFVVQVITLTSALTHTCEDGVTTMGFGDVVLFGVSIALDA